ncbi:MAG: phosphatidylserine decarboxylase [Rhodocyclaceae bacterium]|nr:phosphatidylserine decarboxylase [Rhodocyclaceae bacterium]
MRNYPHPLIAKEGWHYLAASIALALLVHALAGALWALPLWLIALFILQFFRDPPRPVPAGEKNVLAPADGRVIAIEPAFDPWLAREALKISIFMNVFNVHANRAPVDGVVMQRWRHAGRFLNAALSKASEQNERCALHIRTDDGHDVTCVQVAGLIARRILCYVGPGERLSRGQRYGFIRFGSRVDLYLPPEVHVKVGVGMKVYATTSIVAELP